MLPPLVLDATDNLLHLLVQLKVLALQLVNLLHQAVNPPLCLLLNMHYIRNTLYLILIISEILPVPHCWHCYAISLETEDSVARTALSRTDTE